MNKDAFLNFFKSAHSAAWDKFYLYLHGSILIDFDAAKDVDIKLVPRQKVSLKEIESVLAHTQQSALNHDIDLDIMFLRRVNHYTPSHKPSIEEIKAHDIPTLWATNENTASELQEKQIVEEQKYGRDHFYPGVKYKQMGDLCFFNTAEWAPGGYYFNREYHYHVVKGKKGLDVSNITNPPNTDIRDFVLKAFGPTRVTFCIHTNCPINCFYCPQDVHRSVYEGDRTMSLDSFKVLLDKIPNHSILSFSGVSEMWFNPQCLDMLEYAESRGYQIDLSHTTIGLKSSTIDRLAKLTNIRKHHIHIVPEGAKKGKKYLSCMEEVFQKIDGVKWSDHGYTPPPEIAELIDRYDIPRKKKLLEDRAGNLENDKVEKSQYLEGPIYCSWDLTAMPFVYPNGDVYLCCEDWSLGNKLGNLIMESFPEIYSNKSYQYIDQSRMDGTDVICRKCVNGRRIYGSS